MKTMCDTLESQPYDLRLWAGWIKTSRTSKYLYSFKKTEVNKTSTYYYLQVNTFEVSISQIYTLIGVNKHN